MQGVFKYLIALGLSSLVGYGVVYLSLPVKSNAPLAQAQPSPVVEKPGSGLRTGIAGLARGDMAAFVLASEPRPVPEIAMIDDAGRPVTLAAWRGKVILLNVWATWCAPCLKEMPALDRLKAAFAGEAFDVVALNIDRGGPEKPKAFLAKAGIGSIAFLQDPTGKVFADLRSPGMPTTLLIDSAGYELGRLVGPAEWDSADAKALIRAALGKSSP